MPETAAQASALIERCDIVERLLRSRALPGRRSRDADFAFAGRGAEALESGAELRLFRHREAAITKSEG
jgi:hypothetical protein